MTVTIDTAPNTRFFEVLRRKSPTALVFALICGCPSSKSGQDQRPDGGFQSTEACRSQASTTCQNWRCASGVLVDWNLNSTTGEFVALDGTQTDFEVTRSSSGRVQARFFTADGCALTSSIESDGTGAIEWGGQTLSGNGNLSPQQRQTLDDLQKSVLLNPLVGIPHQLGCRNDVSREELAAVLLPWQLMLKFDSAPSTRGQGLEGLDTMGVCRYFTTVGGFSQPAGGPLQLGPSMRFPSTFAIFPLDAVGATESSSSPLEGDLVGSCGSLCRGACGEDCTLRNCKRTTTTECAADGGVDLAVTTFKCGVHKGCVDHDNCYDACNLSKGCNTVAAAFCRKGCDVAAGQEWGIMDGVSWARGGGPYMRYVDFRYERPAPGACSCFAAGTPVTLADGGVLEIEKLTESTRVMGFSHETGQLVSAEVELVLVHKRDGQSMSDVEFSSGQGLQSTSNHPVFTVNRGYIEAGKLTVGDQVVILDARLGQSRVERVISVVAGQSLDGVTYNLKTTASNYFASEILVHNKCLAAESLIDTPVGPRPAQALVPGDKVLSVVSNRVVVAEVLVVHRKTSVLPTLPGKQLTARLRVTRNHVLSSIGLSAGTLPGGDTEIEGPVFDFDTTAGNYLADGVLLEAANSRLACESAELEHP
jgi:hypothetical protein